MMGGLAMKRFVAAFLVACAVALLVGAPAFAAVADLQVGPAKLYRIGDDWAEDTIPKWANRYLVGVRPVDAAGNNATDPATTRANTSVETSAVGWWCEWDTMEEGDPDPDPLVAERVFIVTKKSVDATFTYDDGVARVVKTIRLYLRPKLPAPSIPSSIYRGESTALVGSLDPHHAPGSPLVLTYYRKISAGWARYLTTTVRTFDYNRLVFEDQYESASRYRHYPSFPLGSYKVTATHPEDALHVAATSPARYFSVKAKRRGTKVSLSQSRTYVMYRKGATFTATLRRSARPYRVLKRSTVYVYRTDMGSASKTPVKIRTLRTNTKGQVKFTDKFFGRARYTVRYAGSDKYKPATSRALYTKPKIVLDTGAHEAVRRIFTLHSTGRYEARMTGINMEVQIEDTAGRMYHWVGLSPSAPSLVRRSVYLKKGLVDVEAICWYPSGYEYPDTVRIVLW